MLTFLAGAEIDPVSLRRHWKASISIGVVSFGLPFLGAFGFCYYVLNWHLHAAEIGGIALSTTSVAVVCAVMVETGLNRHDIGKLILAALLHHRPWHRSCARRILRNLRLVAPFVRGRHRRGSLCDSTASAGGHRPSRS
jgi:Sodium/hydrogen exchanger family